MNTAKNNVFPMQIAPGVVMKDIATGWRNFNTRRAIMVERLLEFVSTKLFTNTRSTNATKQQHRPSTSQG